ncbi:MAG TPA: pyruvate dehydrogenase complex dihydrolipoamide acetyltransferase [Candidatus Didemnitutus sp.]|jgi:pyruvate dehydrogenase E2 component (dihydrolipoamide acetyltransferase)
MAEIITMPKLSDTMTVGTLVKWLKKEGDAVKSGDMLAEVETDKATMELESFFDGTIIKVFANAGSEVVIGAALCAIGKPGETVEAPPAAAGGQKSEVSGQKSDTGARKPEVSSQKSEAGPAPAPEAPKTAPSPAAPSATPVSQLSTPSPQPAPADARLRISPLARKIAGDQKIDPSRLTGSGPHGRIVKADVLAAAANPSLLQKPASSGGAVRPDSPSLFQKGPLQEERLVPASNMRAAIARRLLEAKTQIPHFYLDLEVDADPLLALRNQLNTGLEKEGVKLSVNDFVLKASAEALRRVPGVNASWAGNGIQYFASAHVSFAVAIEDGLITPVIRDAHLKSLFAISAEAKPLGKRAKEKKLKPEEFSGGTFCVSNLGMMGIERFCAIINPPNAAILAVGTTVPKPVVKNGQIVVGQTMVLTLSCDHRVVDGALGAQFLGALKELLEKPALLLV